MASGAAPVADDTDLECCVCLGVLTEPVVTPCGHAFDRRCLEKVRAAARGTQRCPKCRTELPPGVSFAVCLPLQQCVLAARPAEVKARLEDLSKARRLGAASAEGKTEEVAQLLKIRGICVDDADDQANPLLTPLVRAIRGGHTGVARLLLEAKASVASTYPVQNALQAENPSMLNLLLQHNAAINPPEEEEDADDEDDEEAELTDDDDEWPRTDRHAPAFMALRPARAPMLRALIAAGLDLTITFSRFALRTPLQQVLEDEEEEDTALLLIDNGAPIGTDMLAAAAVHRRLKCVRRLLQQVRLDEQGDRQQHEVLAGAAQGGCPVIIQAVLRAASIDVNSFHYDTRQSALHVAALHCRPEAVDTLLENGADVHQLGRSLAGTAVGQAAGWTAPAFLGSS
eukprot:COSAG04_NODE_1579_length_6255_cov_57.565627_7_plen_399_part_01